MVNCKVNEQAGGDAPKSIVLQALPLQKWVHMLRKEGAAADFCPPLPAPGWSCSEKWGGRWPRARIFYKVLPLFWVVMLRKNTGFSAVRPGGHAPNFVRGSDLYAVTRHYCLHCVLGFLFLHIEMTL